MTFVTMADNELVESNR